MASPLYSHWLAILHANLTAGQLRRSQQAGGPCATRGLRSMASKFGTHLVGGLEHEFYFPYYQWEFQDPKMEVLYHIRPYFMGIFPYMGLT